MSFRFAGILVLLLLFTAGTVSPEGESVIVLPNPGLLDCKVASCSKLWLDDATSAGAIFPIQLSMDMARGCVYGFRARYAPEVPFEEVHAAIDRKYAAFAVPMSSAPQAPFKLWRVEPQKFAIQLSKGTEQADRENWADAFSKHSKSGAKADTSPVTGLDVIYLRFKDTPCGGAS